MDRQPSQAGNPGYLESKGRQHPRKLPAIWKIAQFPGNHTQASSLATLHKDWASLDMDKDPGVLSAVHPFWASGPGRQGGF